MKSEKNCIKKVIWGIVSGLDPLSVTKKKSILVGSPVMKISGSGHVECSMPEFK